MKTALIRVVLMMACVVVAHERTQAQEEAGTKTIRDLMWVWGNPEMGEPGTHTLATFAQADSAERAKLLKVPNIVMAGNGLPHNDAEALALTADVVHAPRLVWEIGCDEEGGGPPFEYEETVGRVAKVAVQRGGGRFRKPDTQILGWDGRDEAGSRVASGVYLCRLSAGGAHDTEKLLIVK